MSDALEMRWRERLDYEAGLCEPREVQLAVPEGASEATGRVAEGLRLFLGLVDEGFLREEGFTFARSFCMAYCDVTDQEARDAMNALSRAGAIVADGKVRGDGFPMTRWKVGPDEGEDPW